MNWRQLPVSPSFETPWSGVRGDPRGSEGQRKTLVTMSQFIQRLEPAIFTGTSSTRIWRTWDWPCWPWRWDPPEFISILSHSHILSINTKHPSWQIVDMAFHRSDPSSNIWFDFPFDISSCVDDELGAMPIASARFRWSKAHGEHRGGRRHIVADEAVDGLEDQLEKRGSMQLMPKPPRMPEVPAESRRTSPKIPSKVWESTQLKVFCNGCQWIWRGAGGQQM